MESTIERIWSTVSEFAALYGMKIIGAILIIVLGRIVVGLVTRMVARLLERSKTDETLTRFLLALTRIALLTFIFIAALNTLGVQTTSFIAVIGAAGLAVGFALQGSLANFASGVMLILFRPLKTGDLVEVGGHLGVVREVAIFNTIIISPDNKRIIVPNSKVTGDSIVNYSSEGYLRVDLVFSIAYHDNIGKAKGILEGILKQDTRVKSDPAPTVAVMELGDNSVNFAVRPYVNIEDYWGVYFDITEKVKNKFDEQGVTIPFPQRDMHIYQALTTK